MRKLFAFAVLFAACGTEPADPGSDAPAGIDGQAEFTENCSKCHGADGKGTTDGPQILSPVTAYATYVVRHGRGREMGFPTGMDPFDTTKLSDEQLSAILGWLSSAPKPTTGPELYVRFCQNCHGANARSGRVGKNITSELSNLSKIVRFGHGGTNYAARTDYMPAFSADVLTDADLTTLRTFIGTL
jgi:ubiquinol-cytochrome c reductase cytochrome c subunit